VSRVNTFLVSVADLMRRHGASRRVTVEAPVEWRVELSTVQPSPPLTADLTATRVTGGILFRGDVTVGAVHSCHRCLEPIHETLVVDVAQLYSDRHEEEEDYSLDGDLADLEPMLRDEVLLAMPLLPTCDPECAQLVQGTVSDLNDGASADEAGGASPFAVLKDLLGD
jgi:DUF177 domain-containing protein